MHPLMRTWTKHVGTKHVAITDFRLRNFKQLQAQTVRTNWKRATASPLNSIRQEVVETQSKQELQKKERVKKEVIINTKYDKCSDPMYQHLLWSSELDVFQTVKRGKVWLEKIYARKMAVERELRDRSLSAGEQSVPVALEYLYGGSNVVQRKSEAEDITVEAQTTSLIDNTNTNSSYQDSQINLEIFQPDQKEVRRKEYPYSVYQSIRDESEDIHLSEGLDNSQIDDSESRPRGRRRRTASRQRNKPEIVKPVVDEELDFDLISSDLLNPEIRKMFSDDQLFKYGTANPDIASSGVACGGCGAELNCTDEKMPGYLPSQVMEGKTTDQLKSTLCQRCYFIKEYNIALKVSVAPEDYPKTIEHIKDKPALVLLVVDLTDFPGSIWPDILSLLGHNKKIILVANKLDLILPDQHKYVKNISEVVTETFLEKCRSSGQGEESHPFPFLVSSVCVSARTGHNIEVLVDKIFTYWRWNNKSLPGDIYIVGCTNVGKSSIFNALIESDLCKIHAIDLVSKAMTSPVPGTTLDLLKFPITRPEPNFINDRRKRLDQYRTAFNSQEEERLMKLQKYKKVEYSIPSNFSVTHTLKNALKERKPESLYFPSLEVEAKKEELPAVLDVDSQYFREGKWCFDTPGTVSGDQVINLLTAEEINLTLPVSPMIPRTILLKQGHSLILGGMARLDYVSGQLPSGEPKHELHPITVTVFCSAKLPVNVLETTGVDQFLRNPAVWKLTQVPSGSIDRMREFPPLLGKEIKTCGVQYNIGCQDIVLSSAGWVMVTGRRMETSTFIAYTPGGKGITARKPFLPYSVNQKGKRILGSPTYRNDRFYLDHVSLSN